MPSIIKPFNNFKITFASSGEDRPNVEFLRSIFLIIWLLIKGAIPIAIPKPNIENPNIVTPPQIPRLIPLTIPIIITKQKIIIGIA